MKSQIEFKHGDSVSEFFRIKKTTKNLQQQYAELVEKWERCLRSDKNSKYGERLTEITKKMDEIRARILRAKGIKDV